MNMGDVTLRALGRRSALGTRHWWAHLAWVVAASAMGWTVPAVFAGVLRLSRNLFLVPYVAVGGSLLVAYARWSRLDVRSLFARRWAWGLAGAVLAGAFAVRTVLEQPASARPAGLALAASMLWPGLAYGTMDGLLLSVFPVVGAWQAFHSLGWTGRWPGRLAAGVLSLLASVAMIGAYHLGYPEFRGTQVLIVMLGVGVQSLLCLGACRTFAGAGIPAGLSAFPRKRQLSEARLSPTPNSGKRRNVVA
jgi:hypothetical protein